MNMSISFRSRVAACAAAAAIAATALADATRFDGVGTIAGGSTFAVAVSADGNVVAGNLGSPALGGQGFRWTRQTGIVRIGRFGPTQVNTTVNGISGDGNTLVGYADASPIGQAYRWTTAHGLQPIPGNIAYGASFDGSAIVGEMPGTSPGISSAWRWTALTGLVQLGTLSGDENSGHAGARAVSADGLTITGFTDPAFPVPNRSQAFTWSPSTLTLGLGWLFGGSQYSAGLAVSSGGQYVVGESDSSHGRQAFKADADGMVDLGGFAAGFATSRALGVSADGSVVVGSGTYLGQSEAFIWTAPRGMRLLREFLTIDQGAPVSGWRLMSARAISADGNTIVGEGVDSCGRTEGWIVKIGASRACAANFNGDAGLSVQDIFDFMAAWFAGDPRADITQSDCVNVTDIFAFLTAWFGGCGT